MSSHQSNQANIANASTGTYQYQLFQDQVLEIPSNLNYQLENILATGGGVSCKQILLPLYLHYIQLSNWNTMI
jgi:hypothetical protein